MALPRKKVTAKRDNPQPSKDLIHERTLEGMRIVRVGRGQYRAYSQDHPDKAYDVDVSHYGGLGSCTCDDFEMRRFIQWKGVRKNYDIFRCKHLRRVRNHILDQIIQHYRDPREQSHGS